MLMVETVTLYGLLAPFEVLSGPTCEGGREILGREIADRFDDDRYEQLSVNVNHDRRRTVREAAVTLTARRAGLYVRMDLPIDDPVTRAILKARQRFGLSMTRSGHPDDGETVMIARPGVRRVTALGLVTSVAVLLERARPCFAGTWVTTSRDRAIDRMGREHDAAVARAHPSVFAA